MEKPVGFEHSYTIPDLQAAIQQTQNNIASIRTAKATEDAVVRELQIQISMLRSQPNPGKALEQAVTTLQEKQQAIGSFQKGISELSAQISKNQRYIDYIEHLATVGS